MKKYFNNSMLYMSVAFGVYFIYDIYDALSSGYKTLDVWTIIHVVKPVLAITTLFIFNRFTYIANRNRLFSREAMVLWEYMATALIAIGLLSFIELQYHKGEAIYFASCIFLAAFCLAMSNIFKDVKALKDETDLTI